MIDFVNTVLKKCKTSIPRRTAPFVHTRCSITATIPWQHHEFTNTCIVDNFLTIILLHYNQNLQFISNLGNGKMEKSLKAAIMLRQKSSIREGKSLFLRAVQAQLNFQYNNGKYDCYGSECSSLLCLFSPIWKLVVEQKCMSPHCPQKNIPIIGPKQVSLCQLCMHLVKIYWKHFQKMEIDVGIVWLS